MTHDFKASRERLAAVLAGEIPDRVPYIALADEPIGARIAGVHIQELFAMGAKKMAEATLQTYEVLGIDMNVCNLVTFPFMGSAYESHAIAKVSGKPGLFVWKDYATPYIKEGKIAETEKDILNMGTPDHLKDDMWKKQLDAMAIVKEKTGIPQNLIMSLTWSQVLTLRGAQAYVDTVRNPDLLLKLCEKIYASQWDYYQAFCKVLGKPSAVVNAQYSFNRECLSFESAWKFEGQFIARFCKETGLPLVHHNCGFDPYWDELMDKMTEESVTNAGISASHPLDLDYWVGFQKKYPTVALLGGSLFVHDDLELGTAEDVEERVRQNIVKLAPKGRYMVCPICCMPWRIPISNYLMIRDATIKYGKYPIKV